MNCDDNNIINNYLMSLSIIFIIKECKDNNIINIYLIRNWIIYFLEEVEKFRKNEKIIKSLLQDTIKLITNIIKML